MLSTQGLGNGSPVVQGYTQGWAVIAATLREYIRGNSLITKTISGLSIITKTITGDSNVH